MSDKNSKFAFWIILGIIIALFLQEAQLILIGKFIKQNNETWEYVKQERERSGLNNYKEIKPSHDYKINY